MRAELKCMHISRTIAEPHIDLRLMWRNHFSVTSCSSDWQQFIFDLLYS